MDKEASHYMYWNKLDDSEKIERMREEVKRCKAQLDKLAKLVSKFKEHYHSPLGNPVYSIKPDETPLDTHLTNLDPREDVYF